jgi:hypothetical protein
MIGRGVPLDDRSAYEYARRIIQRTRAGGWRYLDAGGDRVDLAIRMIADGFGDAGAHT